MKLLLDTHAFLWSYSDKERLPVKARTAVADGTNEIFVSAISFWEIAMKTALGKLRPVGEHPADLIGTAESLGFIPIPLVPAEAATYGGLTEDTHFDPFD